MYEAYHPAAPSAREHLESLVVAYETGLHSMQQYLNTRRTHRQDAHTVDHEMPKRA